jgi:HAD superfamily hydrolase (TIGR01509 family)
VPTDGVPPPRAESPSHAGRAVLFDLDGVIVDSRDQHMAAWETWAREHAPDAPEGYFLRSFGLRNDTIIGALLEGASPADIDRLSDEKESLFRAAVRGALAPLPGVVGLIDALEDAGIPRAIVTSTPRLNLDLVLEELGLTGRFGALVAAEDVSRGKPDPEGFLIAAQRLDLAAERCVVIEDAPAGIEAARAAGMLAIAVTTTRPAADLAAADLVVDSLADERVRAFILT